MNFPGHRRAARTRASAPRGSAAFSLLLASEGERVCVRGLGGSAAFGRRLMDLGLRVDTTARVVQRNAAGVVLAMEGMRLALGPGAAQRVLVTHCDGRPASLEAA